MSDQSNLAQPGVLTTFAQVGDLVTVQDEATVSRTVLKSAGGRIVVFAFAAGQILTEHTASMPVFVQALEGHLRISGGGETFDLHPGGLVYFPTRLAHAVEAVTDAKKQLIMVDGHTERPA